MNAGSRRSGSNPDLFRHGGRGVWPRALELLLRRPHPICDLHACLLGAVRGADDALGYVRSWVAEVDGPWAIEVVRTLGMRFGAAGREAAAIELLSDGSVVEAMEPLIVALRLRRGEVVDAPVEILEVAADVDLRITALASSGDIWRVDPLGIALPDETEGETEQPRP